MFNNPTPEAGLLNKSLCLGVALGVAKFDRIFAKTLVILCWAILVSPKCSTTTPLKLVWWTKAQA
jgi:hypothetical protein